MQIGFPEKMLCILGGTHIHQGNGQDLFLPGQHTVKRGKEQKESDQCEQYGDLIIIIDELDFLFPL